MAIFVYRDNDIGRGGEKYIMREVPSGTTVSDFCDGYREEYEIGGMQEYNFVELDLDGIPQKISELAGDTILSNKKLYFIFDFTRLDKKPPVDT
ncbi:MAG: hypothetical protein HY832_01075 [Candidatus Aenigmarchaeota archaeon]|nr:hypothetical protein [Candidatus Aenigmarchaeota archaeon]